MIWNNTKSLKNHKKKLELDNISDITACYYLCEFHFGWKYEMQPVPSSQPDEMYKILY